MPRSGLSQPEGGDRAVMSRQKSRDGEKLPEPPLSLQEMRQCGLRPGSTGCVLESRFQGRKVSEMRELWPEREIQIGLASLLDWRRIPVVLSSR